MSRKDKLVEIGNRAREELTKIGTNEELSRFRIKYLGKKGLVTSILKELKNLPPEERPLFGKTSNEIKRAIKNGLEEKLKALDQPAGLKKEKEELFDYTLPARKFSRGHTHPITKIREEVTNIFLLLGFQVVEGSDIETDYYNFEALNMPQNHPARDMQDTFYLEGEYLLRTHTSPVQIHVMEKEQPPLRIIAPGKVYRRDSDVSHTPMFHQVEGLMVDEGISFAHLKGVLELFIHQIFDQDIPIRFRPSFFPFTEPSAEVDIHCVICKGKGCRVCSHSGWLEILGAGMVNPKVFTYVNYDPQVWSGFAFGLGIERIAMLKYGIDDIRLFFENDLRFLEQF